MLSYSGWFSSTNFLLSSDKFEIFDNFEASRRIQAARRFLSFLLRRSPSMNFFHVRVEQTNIKKKNFGSGDELACNTQTTFLASTDTLADRGPNESVGLFLQPKRRQQFIHPTAAFVG